MRPFDKFLVVTWSARAAPSPVQPTADAIWMAEASTVGRAESRYYRTRRAAMADLCHRLEDCRMAGQRVFLGMDIPLGFPTGFASTLTGGTDIFAVWDALAARIRDAGDNANNRFQVAADLNELFRDTGPFWGAGPDGSDGTLLPIQSPDCAGHGLPKQRACDMGANGTTDCWSLSDARAAGALSLLGLPHLAALRQTLSWNLAVWPFEAASDSPVLLAEVRPALIDGVVDAAMAEQTHALREEVQVRLLAEALAAAQRLGQLQGFFDLPSGATSMAEEGWIFGVGADVDLERMLRDPDPDAAQPLPPPLSNDCFALPPGVHWTPVADALEALRAGLRPVASVRPGLSVPQAGQVLAQAVRAARAHPSGANSAVDGYGFAAATLPEGMPSSLPLIAGRAAAGAPLKGKVPPGHAVRILTGALVPDGVDTVVLEEDSVVGDGTVTFGGPVKPGANTRRVGEDMEAGQVILPEGDILNVPDLALLAAAGVTRVRLRRPLRVGVLSTGDEIVPAGTEAGPGKTFDANRPMLLAMAAAWNHAVVDLGHVGDSRVSLRRRLNEAAERADVILTSGGASAGDEDHVSALLADEGNLQTWRVAMKPGRPLAMGLWRGVPVFGLPGNPVAAFVCALVFARPALSLLAGSGWRDPMAFTVPAAFSKRKKPGRREYLRARLTADGAAEVFASEGSGRVTGLSWATGLVELDEPAQTIAPGDPVRFLPFSGFGI